MKEYINRILFRLRTELSAQRLAVAVLGSLMLLICSRLGVVEAQYGGVSPEPTPTPVTGSYADSADGALRFTGEPLSLPGDGVLLRDAVPAGESIYMLGLDAAKRPCLFLMDTRTLEISAVSRDVTGTVVGIGAGADGSTATLSATDYGRYYVTVVTPDGGSAETRLNRSSNISTPLESLLIYGDGFLAIEGDRVLAFDSDGNCAQTYGPYSGSLQLLFGGDDRAVIVSKEYGQAHAAVEVVGGDFSVAETYSLTAGYTEFYSGDGDGLFAATSRSIVRVDYTDGSGGDYADLLLSGGGRTGFIYLSEDSFFSRDDGVPTVWSKDPEAAGPADISLTH